MSQVSALVDNAPGMPSVERRVIASKIDVGAQAAAATGVLGVAVMVWLLVATGYARLSLPHR